MTDSSRQTHRSFTVRVPLDKYLEISTLAKDGGTNMNGKVNELLTLGLGRRIKVEDAIAQFVKRAVNSEDVLDVG